jgi:hypothetical protein
MLREAAAAFMLTSIMHAQVPQIISYQGRVAVGGVNFNGTGTFNFALVNSTGTTSYWSNDGTNLNGTQPASAVSLTVTNGLYSVLLGDATIPNMTAIPASVFTNSDVHLRVWFNDGTHGAQQLSPDPRIASVGYAIVAGSVVNGAVGLPQLGLGTISGSINCNTSDPAHTYVYLRGTNSLAYVGDPNGGNYPFQLTLVPPGSYTLVAHQANGIENTTPVTISAGQTISGISLAAADTATDANNCGSCGNVCNALSNGTANCTSGICGFSCNSGFTACSGACVNLQHDPGNCGSCGAACSGFVTCNSGVCGCSVPLVNCNGTCVNLSTDVSNCGACGEVCGTANNGTRPCISGACLLICNGGYTACNGGCVYTSNDTNNCGACGRVCGTPNNGTSTCNAGACVILSCNPGFADCDNQYGDGCETNLATDPYNCGACGVSCLTGHSCIAGVCN